MIEFHAHKTNLIRVIGKLLSFITVHCVSEKNFSMIQLTHYNIQRPGTQETELCLPSLFPNFIPYL